VGVVEVVSGTLQVVTLVRREAAGRTEAALEALGAGALKWAM